MEQLLNVENDWDEVEGLREFITEMEVGKDIGQVVQQNW